MLEKLPSIMEHGWQSGINGYDPRECPYDKMTEEYAFWQKWHKHGSDYRNEVLNETLDRTFQK